MDAPVSEGEEISLIDIMENANAELANTQLDHHESLKTEITRSLSTLTDRQKEVLCYFFGIGIDNPLSLEDIGHRFHLTRERVRQIKDKAITKLQNTSRCRLLRVYLGV
jgi:RNA polymerase primary sigma factor